LSSEAASLSPAALELLDELVAAEGFSGREAAFAAWPEERLPQWLEWATSSGPRLAHEPLPPFGKTRDWPQTWSWVEVNAREVMGEWWGQLIYEMRRRQISRSVFAAFSIWGVFLRIGFPPEPGQPALLLQKLEGGRVRLSYSDRSNPFRGSDWTHEYDQRDALPALARFLVRVGWFPAGHPALAGIEAT
jgi:hypothetical protein